MSASSLSDVLNDLAGGRAAVLARGVPPVSKTSEFDLFLSEDSLLASLNRDYLYARAQHDAARREHGADSPMADIAGDASDSAWCAMQTRLMELRANGDLMRAVQKKLWDAEHAAQEDKQRQDRQRALDLFNRLEIARLIKEKNKTPAIYEWLALIIIFHRFLRLPFPALGVPDYRAAA